MNEEAPEVQGASILRVWGEEGQGIEKVWLPKVVKFDRTVN